MTKTKKPTKTTKTKKAGNKAVANWKVSPQELDFFVKVFHQLGCGCDKGFKKCSAIAKLMEEDEKGD